MDKEFLKRRPTCCGTMVPLVRRRNTHKLKRLYLPSARYKNEQRFIVKMPYVTNKSKASEWNHSTPATHVRLQFSNFHQHPSSFSIMSPTLLTSPLAPVRFQSVTWFLRHSCTFHVHSSTGILFFYDPFNLVVSKPPHVLSKNKRKKKIKRRYFTS